MGAERRMLVTGGSGYLGRWVVRLAQARWAVTATYCSHPVDEPGAAWVQLDIRDAVAVEELLTRLRPAVVVHTAAVNPGGGGDMEGVNHLGTANVARAAAAAGARLIHLSTDLVFDGRKGRYVEEDEPNPLTPYGHSKALAEAAVRASGAAALIVRTSLIYGWRPQLDRQSRWLVEDARAGRPLRLFTDELRCPIWVESLAAAVVELVERDDTGALHVAGAQALSRYEFGLRLLRFHGVDPAAVIPALSRESGMQRPLDCTLDCSRARTLLATPLPGVDEALTAAGLSLSSGAVCDPAAPRRPAGAGGSQTRQKHPSPLRRGL